MRDYVFMSLLRSLSLSIPPPPLPSRALGMIDVATEWMSDLKEGWCPSAGYYNRESCCWINNETNLNMVEEHCALWSRYTVCVNVPVSLVVSV